MLAWLAATALLGASATCSSPVAPQFFGAWGSADASLVVADTGAALQLLASGSCYGSFGTFHGPIQTGAFDLSGTYTQLIGAYPGRIRYAAQFSGVATVDRIALTITVPALKQTIGPFALTRGVSNSWSPCLYPAAGATTSSRRRR